jgi:hypothetical protein
MVSRENISRARIVEYQETSEKEALEFLRGKLGVEKFTANRIEIEDLVKNYTGGKFKSLMNIVERVDDLSGQYPVFV